MTDCRIAGHGALVIRSDAMCDYYCPDCRAAHVRAYSTLSPGRRLIQQEATLRGGTCEFTLDYGDGVTLRCQRRFEDGGLEWHHLDPEQKVAAIASLASGSPIPVLAAELSKCQLLCGPHHQIAQRRAA